MSDFEFTWDEESSSKGTQTIEEMKNVFQQMASTGRIKAENNRKRRTRKPVSRKK